MPKYAGELVEHVQTFLERTYERCRTSYMEASLVYNQSFLYYPISVYYDSDGNSKWLQLYFVRFLYEHFEVEF